MYKLTKEKYKLVSKVDGKKYQVYSYEGKPGIKSEEFFNCKIEGGFPLVYLSHLSSDLFDIK